MTCLRGSLAVNSTSPSLSWTVVADPAFVHPTGNVAVLAIIDAAGNGSQAY